MARVVAPARSRRSDILAAAEREFAAAGYSGGRVERIAAAAAVNKQLLFHYFESKEGLFLVALDELLERCEPATASSVDQPSDEIRRVLADLQAALRAVPGLLAIIADSAANDGFPRQAAASVRAWRDRLVSRLEAGLAEGQRRGYFRDDFDPHHVARLALAAVLGTSALGEAGRAVSVGAHLVDYCGWR